MQKLAPITEQIDTRTLDPFITDKIRIGNVQNLYICILDEVQKINTPHIKEELSNAANEVNKALVRLKIGRRYCA